MVTALFRVAGSGCEACAIDSETEGWRAGPTDRSFWILRGHEHRRCYFLSHRLGETLPSLPCESHDAYFLSGSGRLPHLERKDCRDGFVPDLIDARPVGRELDDVNFYSKPVTFRQNRGRRLKTRSSHAA